MSNVHKPADAGKDTDPSTPINPLAEILTALRNIAIRLDVLEHRFEYLDKDVLKAIGSKSRPVKLDGEEAEEEAPTTEPDPPIVPGLARLSDGRMALALVHLDEESLEGREHWQGIILTEAEACDALDRLSDAADEAAGVVAGRILLETKKRREREEEEEGGEDE